MSLFGTGLGVRVGDRLRAASWRGRVRQVLDLLDEERALIQRGDLRGLAGLAPRSRAALEELTSAPASESRDGEPELEAIRDSAARNQRLLGAMMEGAAQARRELAQAEKARNRLGYDRAGGTVGAGPSGPGKRA
ncbi:hypothetical protein SAMN05444336_103519 [Albimonas donghaensis]|uniref:FlgN protein n=1 Tax=Albimonas donghaensis TaxID=356660 RepID=A0A1H2ZI12_9RHOB|nr:hypothetical protein [Albimonas donghaensis]SDX17031.1 hypothetical protein SAMN05444336_103519 [Albimonas donghaensis]